MLRHAEAQLDRASDRQRRADVANDMLQPRPKRMIARAHGEPHPRLAVEPRRLVVRRHQRLRLGEERHPRGRRADEAGRALEQLAAECGFQRLDAGADHGLHRARRLGGAREVAELDGEDEQPDGSEGRA